MGWFSDIFSPEVLLPIAAGAFFGPGGAALAKGSIGTAALAGCCYRGWHRRFKRRRSINGRSYWWSWGYVRRKFNECI